MAQPVSKSTKSAPAKRGSGRASVLAIIDRATSKPRATQAFRNMAIATSLPKDTVLLESFTYTEDFGKPFRLTATVTAARPGALHIEETIGKSATLRIRLKDGKDRYLNGIIAKVVQDACIRDKPSFDLTIVPKFWLLSRNSDCRIFQRMSVPEIIKQVFTDRGIDDSLQGSLLKGKFTKHDYIVQYRETDFNFISRLMEMEGIYYYFSHFNGRHELVLANDTSCHRSLDGAAELPFLPPEVHTEIERITKWHAESEITTGRVSLRAFDFKAPNTKPRDTANLDYEHKTSFEIYDYPVEFHVPEQAKHYTKIRAEELAAGSHTLYAQTDCRGICVGGKFKLTDPRRHLRRDHARQYIVSSMVVSGSVSDYQSGGGGDGEKEEFSCSFSCIDAKRIYRPARATPKPTVAGTQTAVVVGPKGQEIHTDKLGRVKLQFHWDRYGNSDENSSCWVRVSQPWAGKGWGGVQIPRIGQEVIVDFLEGDPDRPIITGRVYNADSMPPVSGAGRDAAKGEKGPKNMAEAAMQMTMRSQSLGGGGGYNEITMNDVGGAEKLHIRAEKDEVHLVQNDRKDTVGNDEKREVVNDRTRSVGKNEKVSIGVNQNIDVGQTIVITAGTSITLKCGASTIHMNQAGFITIKGSLIAVLGSVNASMTAPITNVTGAVLLTNTGAVNLTVGGVCRTQAATLASINSGGQAEMIAGADAVVQGKNVKLN